MSIVQVNQGDSILLPTGEKINGIDQMVMIQFETLKGLLLTESKPHGRKKNRKTPGTTFSRIASLVNRAVVQNKWTTGAAISVPAVLKTLYDEFGKLMPSSYPDITPIARHSLTRLASNPKLSSADQRAVLDIINSIGIVGGVSKAS